MPDTQDAAGQFFETLMTQWREHAKSASGIWLGQHKQLAVAYRDFLEKQLSDETMQSMERDWAQRVTKLLLDSMKSQREARTRFLESQRAMVDEYIAHLEKLGQPASGK
jgi:hypothetical protein